MNKRWIFTWLAVLAVIALTAGLAVAAGRGTDAGSSTAATGWSQIVAACDAVHDSPAMERMRVQMLAAAQARCDAMHEQMGQMMTGSGMMGGSGMMSGFGNGSNSGMMLDGSHASHHSGASARR